MCHTSFYVWNSCVHPLPYLPYIDIFVSTLTIEVKSAWVHFEALIENNSLFGSVPCSLQERKAHSLSLFPFLVLNYALEEAKSSFEYTPSTRRNAPSLSAWVHHKGLELHPLAFHNAPCALLDTFSTWTHFEGMKHRPSTFRLTPCALLGLLSAWVDPKALKPSSSTFSSASCALFLSLEHMSKPWSLLSQPFNSSKCANVPKISHVHF